MAQALLTESKRYGFDPFFVLAMIATESRFNPRTVGSVGEIGLLQIRPTTAAWIARKEGLRYEGAQSLFRPGDNLRLGLAYLAFLRDSFESKSRLYLSAYNMGGAAVRRLVARSVYPGDYASRIVGNYLSIYQGLLGTGRASAVLAAN
jgi:soluble lytic murein transglycosylase